MNIVDAFNNLSDLISEQERLLKEKKTIEEKLNELKCNIDLGLIPDLVIDGVPISEDTFKTMYGIRYEVTSYDSNGIIRYDAAAYPNAHKSVNGEGVEWHLNIQEYGKMGEWHATTNTRYWGGRAILLGMPFKIVKSLALTYVLTGKIPCTDQS